MPLAKSMLDSVLRKAFDNVRWILEDVDEEDCFWEPAAPCWSVRRREEAAVGWGTGDWVCEDTWPPPDPLPVTTIAWRMTHLAAWTDVYRNWTFEDQSLGLPRFEVPGTRDGLAGWLFASQDRFRAQVDALDDANLLELRPAHYGPHLPIHRLVSGIAVEHIHHGAEIGLLRDLGPQVGAPLGVAAQWVRPSGHQALRHDIRRPGRSLGPPPAPARPVLGQAARTGNPLPRRRDRRELAHICGDLARSEAICARG